MDHDAYQKSKRRRIINKGETRSEKVSTGGYASKTFGKNVASAFTHRKPTTKNQNKRLLMKLNGEISRFGDDRKLGIAIQKFRQIAELGLEPSIVSYSVLVNAFVRVGEMAKALAIFNSVKNSVNQSARKEHESNVWYLPNHPISPNIVLYTTIIKGLCNDGDLVGAWKILWELIALSSQGTIEADHEKLEPNIRCVNTYIRGCVRCGDVLSAWLLFHLFKYKKLPMDGHSAAMIGKLLCHAGFTEAAVEVQCHFEVRNRIKLESESQSTEASQSREFKAKISKNHPTHNSLNFPATTDTSKAEVDKSFASSTSEQSQMPNSRIDSSEGIHYDLPPDFFIDLALAYSLQSKKQEAEQNLKRAEILINESHESECATKSTTQFLRHRQNEHQLSISRIREFLSNLEFDDHETSFRHLFYFLNSESRIPISVLSSAAKSMGVSDWEEDAVVSVLSTAQVRKMAKCIKTPHSILIEGLLNFGGWKVLELEGTMTEGLIDFKSIFNNSNPIKLEICSGAGDWIIHQSKHDENINWVAVELRHDRIYQIFSKKLMEGLNNLITVGGNANDIIKNYLPTNTFSEIYVNFPEPPPYYDHPQHLLSSKFFTALHPAKVFVVSDDVAYLNSIMNGLQTLHKFYKTKSGVKDGLPKEFGTSSSYFDRFWSNGERKSRGYILFEAV